MNLFKYLVDVAGTPGHLLVKTESGQYQILRVGPTGATATTTTTTVSQQQTVRTAAPATTQQQSSAIRLPTQPVTRPTTTTVTQQQAAAAPVTAATAATAGMGQQMTPDTAKVKCRNFLATLLRLASDQPDSVAKNVRELIQGLIESRIEPELFTTKLQKELNSSPQPCLGNNTLYEIFDSLMLFMCF